MDFKTGFEDDFMTIPSCSSAVSKSTSAEDYDAWLARGRALADSHSNTTWNVGDWLVEGETAFDFYDDVKSIPRHLLIGKKNDGSGECYGIQVPNYWKDAAAQINWSIPCLKEAARVARRYSPSQRVAGLSFSHHLYAEPYDRRMEYLQACLNVPEG